MAIRDIRQFNKILKSVSGVEQHYTDLLKFSIENIKKHGNKDPMLSFLNAPFLRTKTGKIKKAYIPLMQWLNVACPAFWVGEREVSQTTGSIIRTKHTAYSMPAKIEAFDIIFDKQEDTTIQPFTEWLEQQAAEKTPSAPKTKVSAKSLLTYLESKLALELTANDQGEIDALVKAAKALILAAGKATLPAVDETRVDELASTKASKTEKRAGKKAA